MDFKSISITWVFVLLFCNIFLMSFQNIQYDQQGIDSDYNGFSLSDTNKLQIFSFNDINRITFALGTKKDLNLASELTPQEKNLPTAFIDFVLGGVSAITGTISFVTSLIGLIISFFTSLFLGWFIFLSGAVFTGQWALLGYPFYLFFGFTQAYGLFELYMFCISVLRGGR